MGEKFLFLTVIADIILICHLKWFASQALYILFITAFKKMKLMSKFFLSSILFSDESLFKMKLWKYDNSPCSVITSICSTIVGYR